MIIHDTSKTKIIATIGPSCSSREMIHELIIAGIDICRLNFSHSSISEHEKIIKIIKELNSELGIHIGILADLQGPKIRLGKMSKEGIQINAGNKLVLSTKECIGTDRKIFVNYPHLAEDVRIDDLILIDDGKIRLKVKATDSVSEVITEVISGGPINSRKGVNLPDTRVSLPGLTEKDKKDVEFIMTQDIDWVALSFVRSVKDILELKNILSDSSREIKVIAKIEKPEALYDIDQIIEESDAVMIARGDLGVEVSFDRVPLIQKQIVQKCIRKATPVIVATQMLESMMYNVQPTRAEANDVGNAVFDSADCVMLSGETSVGRYPVESIRAMQRIIDSAEGTDFVHRYEHLPEPESDHFIADSICLNACRMADQSGASAIVVFTKSTLVPILLASYRPGAPILVFTEKKMVVSQLSLVWGVWSFFSGSKAATVKTYDQVKDLLKEKTILKEGNRIVLIADPDDTGDDQVNAIRLVEV